MFATRRWNVLGAEQACALLLLLAGCSSSKPVAAGMDAGSDSGSVPGTIVVSALSGSLTEPSSTATFSVSLSTRPEGDVVIPVTVSDPTEGSVSTSSVVLTSTDWMTGVTVDVSAVDDDFADGAKNWTIVLGSATSADARFAGVDPSDVSATTNDDEVAGLVVSVQSGLLCDAIGSSATFDVALATRPEVPTSVPLSTSTNLVTVGPATLDFGPNDWNVAKTVTLTATGADTAADTIIQWTIGSATVGDAPYLGVTPVIVPASVCDLGTRAIVVRARGGKSLVQPLAVDENGWTAAVEVSLAQAPTDDVVITIASSDSNDVTVDTTMLTFTASDWSTPQTVIVSGVADGINDGTTSQTLTLSATSQDTRYTQVPDVVLNVVVNPTLVDAALSATSTVADCVADQLQDICPADAATLLDGNDASFFKLSDQMSCGANCSTAPIPTVTIDLGAVYSSASITIACDSAYMGAPPIVPTGFVADATSSYSAISLVNGVATLVDQPVRYVRLQAASGDLGSTQYSAVYCHAISILVPVIP